MESDFRGTFQRARSQSITNFSNNFSNIFVETHKATTELTDKDCLTRARRIFMRRDSQRPPD